jgi:hypothetical protein
MSTMTTMATDAEESTQALPTCAGGPLGGPLPVSPDRGGKPARKCGA